MAAMAIGDWTRGPAIGRGSSATVSVAVDHHTGAVFAVKSVDSSARLPELRREQSILQGLNSPYIVRCLGLVGRDLFLEYAAGGSLADEIKRLGGHRCAEEEALIRSRARDVLRGLAHAHAAGVAHCDVKARNVLLAADGRAVLADFGCARRIAGDVRGDSKGTMGCTPMFMSPEAARGEDRGAAADIWALGCTVVEMATGGAAPWWPRFADPMAALHHVAVSGEAPECPRWMSEEARDFLGRCFRCDPAERWTAEQLLRHPFVAADADEDDQSNSVPILAGKEPFVSPKSVLEQALWGDDSTACVTGDDRTATAAPAERVRELAGTGAPEWTWDADWITVHSDDDESRSATLPQSELEAGTSGDSVGLHPTASEEAVSSTSILTATTRLPDVVATPCAVVITCLAIVTTFFLQSQAMDSFVPSRTCCLLPFLLLVLPVPAGGPAHVSHVRFSPHSFFSPNCHQHLSIHLPEKLHVNQTHL